MTDGAAERRREIAKSEAHAPVFILSDEIHVGPPNIRRAWQSELNSQATVSWKGRFDQAMKVDARQANVSDMRKIWSAVHNLVQVEACLNSLIPTPHELPLHVGLQRLIPTLSQRRQNCVDISRNEE